MPDKKGYTADQVAEHNSEDDCWVIIDGKVYDVTSFLDEHPGGKKILSREAGQDVTKKFNMFHGSGVLPEFGPDLEVGLVVTAQSTSNGVLRQFLKQEVQKHSNEDDCWIIVDGKVYDVTRFLGDHPGGKKVLLKEGGKDASKKFHMFHNARVMEQYGPSLLIGEVRSSKEESISDVPSDPRYFGDLLPYGDPNWYQGYNTVFYNDSHREWRAHVRSFAEKLAPHVHEWDEQGSVPQEIHRLAAEHQILSGVVGDWPSEYVAPGPKDYDPFHELILFDELARLGSGGLLWGMVAGLSIGLTPVLLFGDKYLKDMVAKDCLEARKFICLAISEPQAGSDVANLQTTAVRNGDHFIVNGTKKWITNGIFADYFTTAVRTGGPGAGGLSLLLIPRTAEGVSSRKMKCMGVWASGTSLITFNDVKVPVSNLIGHENHGFKYIMYNFNHERWSIAVQALRFARVCLEESFSYSLQRKTFDKRLIDHQVIRFKIAEMARMIESSQAWLEMVTYQLKTMGKEESNPKLGGTIALLKAQITKVFEYCAREAVHIFGGAGYVRGGVGEKVERLYREVRAYSIPGGAEEIMLDFAARQAMKEATKNAKM